MKRAKSKRSSETSLDLLIGPDGEILAHQLTPALAAVLARLDPGDAAMRQRATALGAAPPCAPTGSVAIDPPTPDPDSPIPDHASRVRNDGSPPIAP